MEQFFFVRTNTHKNMECIEENVISPTFQYLYIVIIFNLSPSSNQILKLNLFTVYWLFDMIDCSYRKRAENINIDCDSNSRIIKNDEEIAKSFFNRLLMSFPINLFEWLFRRFFSCHINIVYINSNFNITLKKKRNKLTVKKCVKKKSCSFG